MHATRHCEARHELARRARELARCGLRRVLDLVKADAAFDIGRRRRARPAFQGSVLLRRERLQAKLVAEPRPEVVGKTLHVAEHAYSARHALA